MYEKRGRFNQKTKIRVLTIIRAYGATEKMTPSDNRGVTTWRVRTERKKRRVPRVTEDYSGEKRSANTTYFVYASQRVHRYIGWRSHETEWNRKNVAAWQRCGRLARETEDADERVPVSPLRRCRTETVIGGVRRIYIHITQVRAARGPWPLGRYDITVLDGAPEDTCTARAPRTTSAPLGAVLGVQTTLAPKFQENFQDRQY